ncbi:MAG: glycosyltransferase family 4 protein [Bdellovibrionales bacterium]|nr:glycosyltransferase family 4 protein [Bdellovibrionales bacterium]
MKSASDSIRPAVLHIIDQPGLGGAQTLLRDLQHAADEGSFDHFVFALRYTTEQILTEGGRVELFPSKRRYSFAPLFRLRRLVEQQRISVLHVHLFRSWVFGALLKQLWYPHLPLITHQHGGLGNWSVLERQLFPFIRKHTDRFIAVSEIARQGLEQLGIAGDKIRVVPNPSPSFSADYIDKVDAGALQLRETLGLADVPILLFAGRLERQKGCDILLQALHALRCDYQLLVIGHGSCERDYRSLSESLGIGQRIHFLGYQQEVDPFFRLATVTVVPSRMEPFGRIPFESAAMGTPVIAANVGGMKDFLRDEENSLLFEPEDVQGLARQIERLLNDSELRVRLAAALTETAKGFPLSDTIASYEQCYRDLIDGRSADTV